jgi:hypothetical protein
VEWQGHFVWGTWRPPSLVNVGEFRKTRHPRNVEFNEVL